jgi:hypothetical protein
LALSEGFEEFGIDRIYAGKHRPQDTFALDSSEEIPDISQQTSNTIGPSSSISSLPSRNKDESIDSMPSPTRVGLQSRPKKADAFGKWRKDRRVATMQANAQRQSGPGGSESTISTPLFGHSGQNWSKSLYSTGIDLTLSILAIQGGHSQQQRSMYFHPMDIDVPWNLDV